MPRPIVRFVKDPNAKLDYVIDWSLWLSGDDTIASHEIIDAADITIDESTNDDTSVRLVVSGGKAGKQPTATCRVTTTSGLIDDRTVAWRIREQ